MTDPVSLRGWTDTSAGQETLLHLGLSASAASQKACLFAHAARSLIAAGASSDSPAGAVFVPGRIEVLGKHTDYCGGRSLLAAAERGFCLLLQARQDAQVRITDARSGQTCRFDLQPDLEVPTGDWFNYPMTVGRRLARNFPPPLRGADIAFASDLPPAAGMSSSSGLMVAAFLALSRASGLADRPEYRANIEGPESLAEYLGTVENGRSYRSLAGDRGVGTFGGSEDHIAMLCCREGFLSQYSYCPVRRERTIALPTGYCFAIASSGVLAEKTGSAREKYNRASLLAAEAARCWRESSGRGDPHLAAAVRSGPQAAEGIRQALREGGGDWLASDLLRRFEHFLAESEEIIPAAGDALAGGRIEEFGRQVDRSQELAERLLGNQVPQTVYLARSARELGAVAASAFGAGFGGSVWALLPRAGVEEFLARWSDGYSRRFAEDAARSAFFQTGAGRGAFEIDN